MTVMVAHGGTGPSANAEVAPDGSFTVRLAAAAGYTLSVVQTDPAGNAGPAIAVQVPESEPDEDLPPTRPW